MWEQSSQKSRMVFQRQSIFCFVQENAAFGVQGRKAASSASPVIILLLLLVLLVIAGRYCCLPLMRASLFKSSRNLWPHSSFPLVFFRDPGQLRGGICDFSCYSVATACRLINYFTQICSVALEHAHSRAVLCLCERQAWCSAALQKLRGCLDVIWP